MILFKRIGESFRHIEDREWVLLFLETMGVLAGILIAFELQEWASQRSEARRKHNQLERLLVESEDNVATLRDQRAILKQYADEERAFTISLVHDGTCPPAGLWNAVEHMKRYPAFDLGQGVYEEMMGSGGLSTIDSEYVRKTIREFHEALDYWNNQNDFFRLKLVQPVSDDDLRQTVDFDPQAEDPISWKFNRAALCADHSFRNRVATAARNHEVLAVNARNDVTAYAIKMCVAIARELGRTCTPGYGGPLVGDDAKMVAKALREAKVAEAD